LNVFSVQDAADQLPILRAIATSDLHNLVFQLVNWRCGIGPDLSPLTLQRAKPLNCLTQLTRRVRPSSRAGLGVRRAPSTAPGWRLGLYRCRICINLRAVPCQLPNALTSQIDWEAAVVGVAVGVCGPSDGLPSKIASTLAAGPSLRYKDASS